MNALLYVLLVFGSVVFVGCDGHFRRLYLRPQAATTPPWSVGSVVITIDGTEDVPAIVARAASALEMKRYKTQQHQWVTVTGGRSTFFMSVTMDAGGYWVVRLIDWPEIMRSEESKKAEALIRTDLDKKQNPSARSY